MEERKVIYPLPYPGLLPDNPLYFLKSVRDSMFVFTTRDAVKKAQLYLLLSDKHTSAALLLAEKGKEELAIKELQKSEHFFEQIPPLLKSAKKQGSTPPSNDLMTKLYQSNMKRGEIITEVMKKTTQGNITTLKSIFEANKKMKKTLTEI